MSHNRSDTYAALSHITLAAAVAGFIDVAFSDTVDIDYFSFSPDLPPRAFAVFSAGDLKITTMKGKTDVYLDGELNRGQFYPEAIRRVFATGTTITKMRIYF